jgi:hypothetical protein
MLLLFKNKIKMKSVSNFLIFIVLTSIIFSCGNKRTHQEKVSAMVSNVKEPFLIVSLKPQNLIDKSGVNEDGVLPYTYQTLTSFFLQEEGTGVDYDEQIQMVLAKGPMLPNMFAFFKIQDQSLFKEMVKSELNAKIKDKENTNYFIKDKEGYVIAWQDETGMVANIPFDFKAMFSGNADDGHKTLNRMIKLFEASNEGNINKDYQTFLTKSDDIDLYLMNDSLISYIQEINPLSKKGKNQPNKDLAGSVIQMYLNFENGKAILKSDMTFSDEFMTKINFINDKGIDLKYLNFGKTSMPITTYSLNFDLEKYLTFIDDFSDGKMVKDLDENLSKYGLAANDVVKAFKGEVLFMLDGYKIKTKTIDYGYGEPFEEQNVEPLVGIAIGLKDPSILAAIFENAEPVSETMVKMEDIFIVTKDDVMFISNDSLWADMVEKNSTNKIKTNAVINQQPIASYTDFSNKNVADYFKAQGYDPTSILESVVMFMNINNSEITLNLKDKSQNSLKVLVKFYSDLMADLEAQQNQDMQSILDQEILDNLNDEMGNLDSTLDEMSKEIDKALEDVDVEKTVDEATKQLNGILNGIKH